MILIVVESPGKIKKLESILGKDYKVISSVGHIIDLPPKKLGVDIEKNFEPEYRPLVGKTQVIKELISKANKADEVILGADLDREGEMIAWSVKKVLKLSEPKRIVFDKITKASILHSIQNWKKINGNLVEAQKTRRILDRILGFYLSPLLWKHVQPGLSAGRVQSVVTKIIVEREKEIETFLNGNNESYFKFNCQFKKGENKYESILYENNNIAKLETEKEARKILNEHKTSSFKVKDIVKKTSQKNPSEPFTTSTLQQEAGRKLGYNVKKTMMCAQNLYEAGYITYMRTDSINLSKEIMDSVEQFVKTNYGNNYHRRKEYKSKGKNTQEAHEAVRVSNVSVTKVPIKGKIKHEEQKLYSLIWKRTVASQMTPAIFDLTDMIIESDKIKKYHYKTTFSSVKFKGFLAVYNIQNQNEEDDTENIVNSSLPKKNDKMNMLLTTCKKEYKSPPSRYTETMLVKKMDPKDLNIGRPATYSATISKIQERGYVEMRDNPGKKVDGLILTLDNKNIVKEEKIEILLGEDKNRLTPTYLGKTVTEFLEERFPKIMDYNYTSEMEDKLDDIAMGKEKRVPVLSRFYKEFYPIYQKIKDQKSIKKSNERILGKYEGEDVILAYGKYGAYVRLSETKFKKSPVKAPLTYENITLKEAIELLKYPKLLGVKGGKQILLKKGQYGLYVSVGKNNIPVDDDNISLDEIEQKLKEQEERKKGLLQIKDETKVYTVKEGPYGKYIQLTDTKNKKIKINAKLPEDVKIEQLDLDVLKGFVSEHFEKKRNRFKKKPKK